MEQGISFFKDKKKRTIIGVAVVLLICVGVGLFVYRELFSETANEEVYVSSVSTWMGNLDNGMRNRYQGVVESNKTWSLKIEGERPVKEYKVKVGDYVKKGDEVLVFDNSETENAIASGKLELQRMRDDLAEMNADINELSREQGEVTDEIKSAQISIDIQQKQLDVRNKSYDIESKQQEVSNLESRLVSASVYSEIDGVVRSLGTEEENDSLTVVDTSSFQVKAKVNEQNLASLYKGAPVIIYSRADNDLFWHGKIVNIDKEHTIKSEDEYDESGDEMTKSTNYPFYISLKDKSGLTVGQHVYVEEDVGQLDEGGEEVIDLPKFLIVDPKSDSPYVWADDGHGHLEKRSVTLGEYNKKAKRYRIEDGLVMTDLLAQPEEDMKAGIRTVNTDEQNYEEYEDTDGSEDSEDEEDEEEEDELGDALDE
ncbi:MAG: efflux RND transporter periplasmic adaptor subunit [Lachnospiraceae bacterium]|nr:efflux RND transporter periplasmic adaptor subunit [Lachnospiraceae bacterium]